MAGEVGILTSVSELKKTEKRPAFFRMPVNEYDWLDAPAAKYLNDLPPSPYRAWVERALSEKVRSQALEPG